MEKPHNREAGPTMDGYDNTKLCPVELSEIQSLSLIVESVNGTQPRDLKTSVTDMPPLATRIG